MVSHKKAVISISIVSHGQLNFVANLLRTIDEYEDPSNLEFIITENLSSYDIQLDYLKNSSIRTITNYKPKGFAANHNQAFKHATGEYFCIINPDVLFVGSFLSGLIDDIESGTGDIVAPLVVNSTNEVQDSFRSLPTPKEILLRRIRSTGKTNPPQEHEEIYPDWIAGIFLLMKSETYDLLGGFDERYHMYFEDVDFGSRARFLGLRLFINTQYRISHDAQRESHRNFSHLFNHTVSAIRFFTSPVYRNVRRMD